MPSQHLGCRGLWVSSKRNVKKYLNCSKEICLRKEILNHWTILTQFSWRKIFISKNVTALCWFYTLYYSPIEGVECGLQALHAKLTNLILQTRCSSYNNLMQKISPNPQALSANTYSLSSTWKSCKDNDLGIDDLI